MRHIRIFFQAVFLSVFSIAAVSGIEPGIIFDGISRLHGSGWSDPKVLGYPNERKIHGTQGHTGSGQRTYNLYR